MLIKAQRKTLPHSPERKILTQFLYFDFFYIKHGSGAHQSAKLAPLLGKIAISMLEMHHFHAFYDFRTALYVSLESGAFLT